MPESGKEKTFTPEDFIAEIEKAAKYKDSDGNQQVDHISLLEKLAKIPEISRGNKAVLGALARISQPTWEIWHQITHEDIRANLFLVPNRLRLLVDESEQTIHDVIGNIREGLGHTNPLSLTDRGRKRIIDAIGRSEHIDIFRGTGGLDFSNYDKNIVFNGLDALKGVIPAILHAAIDVAKARIR